MKGWIKLHRQILDNVELMGDPTARFIFIHLLLKANPMGKVLISMEELGSELGMEKSVVFRATQRLEKWHMTQRATQRRKSLITICNWGRYQSTTQRPTQNSRNTDATQTQRPPLGVRIENKNKEGLKDRREKYGKGYSTFQQVGTLIKQKEIKVNK